MFNDVLSNAYLESAVLSHGALQANTPNPWYQLCFHNFQHLFDLNPPSGVGQLPEGGVSFDDGCRFAAVCTGQVQRCLKLALAEDGCAHRSLRLTKGGAGQEGPRVRGSGKGVMVGGWWSGLEQEAARSGHTR